MDDNKLKKIEKKLGALRKKGGVSSRDIIKQAKKLGRVFDARGKEPTYVNEFLVDQLPISIPDEKDLAPGTKHNILDALERDCYEWKIWLESKGDNYDKKNAH